MLAMLILSLLKIKSIIIITEYVLKDVPHPVDRKTRKANKDKDWNRVYFNKKAKDKAYLP